MDGSRKHAKNGLGVFAPFASLRETSATDME